MSRARTISRIVLAIAFVAAGVNHFLNPDVYVGIIPPWLPAPELLNLISGAAEIAGGIGVLIPHTRRAAGIGLVLLLIAVFPANLHMALHDLPGIDIPKWILYARLSFQLVLIAWVIYSCELKKKSSNSGTTRG